jgi:hypothetical protein
MKVAFRYQNMVFLRSPGGEDLLNFVRLKVDGVKLAGRRGQWGIYVTDPNGYTVEVYAD